MANITNLLLEVAKPSGWWASIYYWLESYVIYNLYINWIIDSNQIVVFRNIIVNRF